MALTQFQLLTTFFQFCGLPRFFKKGQTYSGPWILLEESWHLTTCACLWRPSPPPTPAWEVICCRRTTAVELFILHGHTLFRRSFAVQPSFAHYWYVYVKEINRGGFGRNDNIQSFTYYFKNLRVNSLIFNEKCMFLLRW